MCEEINDAIIQEDFTLEKTIYDESNGLWYELRSDNSVTMWYDNVASESEGQDMNLGKETETLEFKKDNRRNERGDDLHFVHSE